MSSYWAFTKKEFLECFRTSKLIIMIMVFILLGIMNPVLAKITPELLSSLQSEGMTISVAETTALDSWTQYYKNMPQMGLIVLVVIFSGILSNEISKGTLINVLTKGLHRTTVILAKMTMAVTVWTVSYFLAFLVSYFYTAYFWPDGACDNLFLAAACLWLFGVMMLASIMVGSVIFKGIAGCLLFAGGFVAVMFILNLFPKIAEFNPMLLASGNMNLITGAMDTGDFIKPIIVCIILIIAFLFSSCTIFKKIYL